MRDRAEAPGSRQRLQQLCLKERRAPRGRDQTRGDEESLPCVDIPNIALITCVTVSASITPMFSYKSCIIACGNVLVDCVVTGPPERGLGQLPVGSCTNIQRHAMSHENASDDERTALFADGGPPALGCRLVLRGPAERFLLTRWPLRRQMWSKKRKNVL